MSLITISNDRLSVVISTLGAEMQSITDRDGNERLWNGDPAFWTGRAPILFPMCGGLKDDTYILDGVRYTMPKHGFARRSEWELESSSADEAVFLLTRKTEGFPFDYELRANYKLNGNQIVISYTVVNKDSRTFWYTIGSHEAWATPGKLEDYTVVFEQPERLDDYVLEGNLIGTEPITMAESASELAMKTEYFKVDALVFPHLKGRSVTLKSSKHNRTVRVDYSGMDVLMLWTKPGANYLCIEPWCSAPDYKDTDMQIAHKTGCICLAPGESAVRTHTVTLG